MSNPTPFFPQRLHVTTDVSKFSNLALGETNPSHVQLEGRQEEEIIAIQTKLGIGVSLPVSGTILASTVDGESKWVPFNILSGGGGGGSGIARVTGFDSTVFGWEYPDGMSVMQVEGDYSWPNISKAVVLTVKTGPTSVSQSHTDLITNTVRYRTFPQPEDPLSWTYWKTVASKSTDIDDFPKNILGQAHRVLAVNSDESGFTLVDAGGGGASGLLEHLDDFNNPHKVTKDQLGLGSVDNIKDVEKPVSVPQLMALNLKADLISGVVPSWQLPIYMDNVVEYADGVFPPIGEPNWIYVDTSTPDRRAYRWSGTGYFYMGGQNTLILGEEFYNAYRGTSGTLAYDHARIARKTDGLTDQYHLGEGNPHGVNISMLGLNYVNNTPDWYKPVSLPMLTLLDVKADLINGKVPAAQLPGFIESVVEVSTYANLPYQGELNTIYVTSDTRKTYRWTGSIYIELPSTTLLLGDVSGTAFRGDYGNTAYNHSQLIGNPHGLIPGDLGIPADIATTSQIQDLHDTITLEVSDGYVAKIVSKGLSTNDFSNYYKARVDSITGLRDSFISASDWDSAELGLSEAKMYGVSKVILKAPIDIEGTYSLVFPVTGGQTNQVLKSDGNGGLFWASSGGGGGGGGTASDTEFIPYGSITGFDVQTAIQQVDNLKAPITSPNFKGTPKAPTGTDYTTSRLRNIKLQTTTPTNIAEFDGEGSIIFVYS